jgi:spore coat polysaccharide biosynthesis predicted glycosyltransferase SpsG
VPTSAIERALNGENAQRPHRHRCEQTNDYAYYYGVKHVLVRKVYKV